MADAQNNAFHIGSLALLGSAYQRKILQITQANTQAAFDYAASLGRCQSPEQFVSLTQDYTRRQIETFQRQSRELIELVQDETRTKVDTPVPPK